MTAPPRGGQPACASQACPTVQAQQPGRDSRGRVGLALASGSVQQCTQTLMSEPDPQQRPMAGIPTAEAVDDLVRTWLADAAGRKPDVSARRLAALLQDPSGLAFAVAFIDGVIRPEDARVAARNLRELSRKPPAFLPAHLRSALRMGGAASDAAPTAVTRVARAVLRQMLAHLVLDATPQQLGSAIARLRADGTKLNLNLLGEAVLGRQEADRRLQSALKLLQRDDVDYVSLKVSAAVPPHSSWAFRQVVEEISERLLPLFRAAGAVNPQKFINLDMEEYRDLDLTIAVFTQLLDLDELLGLEAGVVLQAYLPDALAAMERLQEWAAARTARGGARIKVRLVKGANLPMERVDARMHGWPLTTWPDKTETDANYKRVLLHALTQERTANVRLGIASHNLFDVAFAWLLAGERGVQDAVEFEMLLGMAGAQAAAVRETVGPLRLYTPIVHPAEFDVAIAYLIRRLEEVAAPENFLSAAFALTTDEQLLERERQRFLASLAAIETLPGGPRRTQDRNLPVNEPEPGAFSNAPDSDPALAANRLWARKILMRVRDSAVGETLVHASTVIDPATLEHVLAGAAAAAPAWARLTGAQRAAHLRGAAVELERRRGELIEVMAAECDKTLDQSDTEVSEAVDMANYYAELGEELDLIDGAVPVGVGVTLVTPPWNFPVAITAGTTIGPLAAGSAVILKPAPQARRCGAVLAQALWAAGIPRDVLVLVNVDEGELGRQLVADPRIGRLLLTGAYDTAALFRGFRPDLPLLAETSGKNAIVITPSADIDLAVRDLVASAFGHAGQKCSAASMAILVGPVAHSPRFQRQLIDAVSSLHVGYPWHASVQMGPLIEPASGKLAHAFTTVDVGEHWLVKPEPLDDTGRLWSPGVKTGVQRGSEFHMTEYFGPVLGLLAAADLDEAIAIQNQTPYGLTAGLHSLDREEIEQWLGGVRAGNLYVNRGITGAIVRRQPFGGWKRSAVGAGFKAGGPNYLIGLSDWRNAGTGSEAPHGEDLSPGASAGLLAADALGLTSGPLDRALRSDAYHWRTRFSRADDVSGLEIERNVFRYLPTGAEIRSADGDFASLIRVAAAAALAHSPSQSLPSLVSVSVPSPLPPELSILLAGYGFAVTVQPQDAWLEALPARPAGRVRLLSGEVGAGGRPPRPHLHQPARDRVRPPRAAALPTRAVCDDHRTPLRNTDKHQQIPALTDYKQRRLTRQLHLVTCQ